jgi:1,4-dihydroxy-2-naphthoate octaprenyltransferase
VALQVPLFTAVVSPALVGFAIAWQDVGVLRLTPAALVILALIFIQAGANLQKGLVESADRGGPRVDVPSIFIFDSGAVEALGWPRRSLSILTGILFVIGGLAGVYLVLTYGDLVLLALGTAGGLLGFFYSAPPLKLSYRGIGEVATFLAFGPLLVLGVAYLFAQAILASALWTGVVMGLLASLISFERYFPLAEEDRGKGKRTPVVLLGPTRATTVLWTLLAAPYLIALVVGLMADPRLLPFLLTLPIAVVMARYHVRGLKKPCEWGVATGLAVLLHLVGGLILAASYVL